MQKAKKEKDEAKIKALRTSRSERQKLEKKKELKWIIKITIFGLFFSISLNYLSHVASGKANIWATIIILAVLLLINYSGDAIALAATSCELSPLLAMAARKEKGAKTAIWLIKNSEKVSSVLMDVLGDMSGVLSGVFIVAIAMFFFKDEKSFTIANILLPALFGALLIGGKAIVKVYTLKNPQRIVVGFGKIVESFKKKK